MMAKKTKPIEKEEDVQKNPDPHIDQDYPGFPHSPSQKENIKPSARKDKKAAEADKKTSKKTYG